MKAYIITLPQQVSIDCANKCKKSANFDIQTFDAITPTTLLDLTYKWTYPWIESEQRWEGGMYLTAYKTRDHKKRIACFMSHYSLWKTCVKSNEDTMILEHDAEFIRPFDYKKIKDLFTGDILGLNDPTRATRKYKVFDNNIKKQYNKNEIVVDAPWIDNKQVPQGLAGNSAYILKPPGAKKLLDLVDNLGMWPNDAIMCKQLMPNSLQCIYPYYTKVQGIMSTTTK